MEVLSTGSFSTQVKRETGLHSPKDHMCSLQWYLDSLIKGSKVALLGISKMTPFWIRTGCPQISYLCLEQCNVFYMELDLKRILHFSWCRMLLPRYWDRRKAKVIFISICFDCLFNSIIYVNLHSLNVLSLGLGSWFYFSHSMSSSPSFKNFEELIHGIPTDKGQSMWFVHDWLEIEGFK